MTIQNARSNTAGNLPPGSVDGQFLINQADDVLFTHKPDGTTRRFLLPKRRGIADTLVTIGISETYIGIASLTASRAVSLPTASAYPVGHALAVVDESGSVSPTVMLTLTAQGTDKINGNSTLALTTAFGGVLLFSDGASKWTAIALPAGGASNALLYVAQSLTSGQQDQARANLSGAAAASQSATNTLAVLDFDRDQFVTGTSTLTMPSTVAPGWRSGEITNDNTLSGIVTLAVPGAHTLDGVSNGTIKLAPKQRARLRLVSAGTWRSVVDRIPIISTQTIASTVASVDLPMPVGYAGFEILISGLTVDALTDVGLRFSSDGGATFKSGASDYYITTPSGSSASPTPTSLNGSASSGLLAQSMATVGTEAMTASGIIHPGSASLWPAGTIASSYLNSTPNMITRLNGIRTQTAFLANFMRVIALSANLTGGTITLRGMPA
jgi:hypothetical protein